MLGPYVHNIDPIIATLGGVHLWWYGLSYTLGLLQMYLFIKRRRGRLGLTLREVYSLSLLLAFGVLAGGRLIEVAFDEWPFYSQHPLLIPSYWLGGMASHGVMVGALAGTLAFVLIYKKPFLSLADELVIPGAFLMGVGRIGNFIDGQIVGGLTDVWWAVDFPDAVGFRHPVVLYDGAKNLMLVPFLFWVRKTNKTPGATAARFVFWYAFLRIFIDLFRDYPSHRFEIGTGQTLNILMATLGIVLLIRSRLRRKGRLGGADCSAGLAESPLDRQPLQSQQLAFAAVLLFCLIMPSNWTQDVPARYEKRHPGLKHSWLYPKIDTSPPADKGETVLPTPHDTPQVKGD
jgi:phosphatidylglycerol:prolipoprotein diacylglycerol transferase